MSKTAKEPKRGHDDVLEADWRELSVKRRGDIDSIDGVAMSVSPIMICGNVMARIIAYIDNVSTIANLLVAAGRFAQIIVPCVTDLSLVSRSIHACAPITFGFVGRFCNLVTFSLSRTQRTNDHSSRPMTPLLLCAPPDAALVQQTVQNRLPLLPLSLQCIQLNVDAGDMLTKIVGDFDRPSLTRLKLRIAIEHFTTGIFRAPNLTCLEVGLVWNYQRHVLHVAALNGLIETLAKNCPAITCLAIRSPSLAAVPSSTLGIQNVCFKYLANLTNLTFNVGTISGFQIGLVFPPRLESLVIGASFLELVQPDICAMANLKNIQIIGCCARQSLLARPIPPLLEEWAPNLETLISGTDQDSLSLDIYPDIPSRFKNLRTISGDILAHRPHTWSYLAQLDPQVRCIQILPAQFPVPLARHTNVLCNVPSLKNFFIQDPDVLCDLPVTTLCEITKLIIVEVSVRDWSALVSSQSHISLGATSNLLLQPTTGIASSSLVKLVLRRFNMRNFLRPIFDVGAGGRHTHILSFNHNLRLDFDSLKQLQNLDIGVIDSYAACTPITCLQMLRELMDTIGHISLLSSLRISIFSEDVFVESLCRFSVNEVRHACPSLLSLMTRLHRTLVDVRLNFPVVGLDESPVSYFGHIQRLHAFIWRGGTQGFDESNFECLQRNFAIRGTPSTIVSWTGLCSIRISVVQPTWYVKCPTTGKRYICANAIPEDIDTAISFPLAPFYISDSTCLTPYNVFTLALDY